MGQHIHELLHVAAATLFLVAAISALLEYRALRERVVLTYAASCLCAAGYACHVTISHNLPKAGTFWLPWTALGLSATFGATFFYLLTMQKFVGAKGRLFTTALAIQAAISLSALLDVLLYAVARRSFMFVSIARPIANVSQREMGEGAYSLLPAANVVAALFVFSYVFGVGYLLVHLLRARSREVLVYVGLFVNSALVVNDTLVAMSVFGGWYLMALSKAFETARIHNDIRTRARERSERRLRNAQKMEVVGRMAGGIAHDFNNVLAAVGGSLELATEAAATGQATGELLELAREGVDTGQRLVRQLMDVARAEETKPELVDVNDFLSRNGKLLSSMVSSGAELEVSAEPAIGAVRIAPGRLTQVLMNLLINARDAMPKRGVIKIRAAVQRSQLDAPAQPEVVISVIDEGLGIPADVLEHVFEPFFTTKAERGGSGLGLATLYSIVRDAGGHVEVASKVGRGTRFDVVLPRFDG